MAATCLLLLRFCASGARQLEGMPLASLGASRQNAVGIGEVRKLPPPLGDIALWPCSSPSLQENS